MKTEPDITTPQATSHSLCQTFVLHDNWTFSAGDMPDGAPHEKSGLANLRGVVPGCVHTDLMRLGLIEDPYHNDNEQACQWVSSTSWTYRCRFARPCDLEPGDVMELVADGIDTVASVVLNGIELGTVDNMHVSHTWRVDELLRDTGNELEVRFAAPLTEAKRREAEYGPMPRAMPGIEPYNFVRKMACNFGWDWGPVLTTVGLWQPIYLRRFQAARFERVRPLVMRADEETAELRVHPDITRALEAKDEPLRYELALYDADGCSVTRKCGSLEGGDTDAVTLLINKPQLWWPRGYGGQPLYRLEAYLYDTHGRMLDHTVHRVGLRQIELDRAEDDAGSAFTLRVNGRPVFCKGANWIPDDCFPSRVTPEQVYHRLDQACEANMNMLRVWGGGLFESDYFYERCDELGLMVWQDMLFACAMYPEAMLRDTLEVEVRQNAARLSAHASLVIYCGGNESIWFHYQREAWRTLLDGRPWGETFYRELMPQWLAETDPSRPYIVNSPDNTDHDGSPNDAQHGVMHLWEAWKREPATSYRDHRPRFASEFGFCGPANPGTLRRVVTGYDECVPDDPKLMSRFKAVGGQESLDKHYADFFDKNDDLDAWNYLAQVVQARSVTTGVEWFRSLWPYCTGSLYWQLNDCWPTISWSAISSDGSPKLLWHASKRSLADRLVTIQPDGEGLACMLINDSDESWSADLRLRRVNVAGEAVAEWSHSIEVAPRSVERVPLTNEMVVPERGDSEFIVADAGDLRGVWFFEPDKAFAYEVPRANVSIRSTDDGYEVTVTAQSLLRDLVLWPDAIAPRVRVDNQLVTLLPGESHRFTVHTSQPITLDTHTWLSALRCCSSQAQACRVEVTDPAAVS